MLITLYNNNSRGRDPVRCNVLPSCGYRFVFATLNVILGDAFQNLPSFLTTAALTLTFSCQPDTSYSC